jgi:hypothetical protein
MKILISLGNAPNTENYFSASLKTFQDALSIPKMLNLTVRGATHSSINVNCRNLRDISCWLLSEQASISVLNYIATAQ